MAIGKPRGKRGMRPVYVYDPKAGRKVYVGSRQALRGPGGAQELERQKTDEFNGKTVEPVGEMTCDQYADRWLSVKHGDGTRRPASSTEKVNRGLLKPFRAEFGDRLVSGGISREEALDWSKAHPTNAKAVSAMFNDAMDDGRADANPFGNRRLPQKRGRKDIEPLTEKEIELLAELAVQVHGLYGKVIAGWVMFIAWVACRPGEAFQVAWPDLDLDGGRVTVHRVKGGKDRETIVLPPRAVQALREMPKPHTGRVFLTPQGKPYNKGNAGYYWRDVRAAFVARLADENPDRLAELRRVKGALDVYALRHMGASMMADRGLSEFDIAMQMGNSPEVARKTYIHSHKNRTLERVAAALESPTVRSLDAARQRRIGGSK